MKRLLSFALVVLASLAFTGCAASGNTSSSIDLGEWAYQFIVGGVAIGEATLLRFYVWHIVGLIAPMAFLIGWHAFRVRRDGGISHKAREGHQPEGPRMDREQLVRTETIAFFLTLATLIILAVFVDAPIGNPPGEGISANEVEAPWIFLWVQELLRIWPPAIAGVLVPALVTALFVALPFIDRKDDGIAVWFNKQGRIAQILFSVAMVVVIGLTVVAALR